MRAVIAALLLCGAAAFSACGDDSSPPEPAHFAVYDWEPNVIGPSGTPEPVAREVTDVPVSKADARARAAAARGKTVTVGDRAGKGVWVLRDRPRLTTRDVASARQTTDPVTADPIVVLTLTPAGKRKLERLTEGVATRARTRRRRGGGAGPEGFERFAIVLDGRLVSLPTVDADEAPGGLDADEGIELHVRGTLRQAQEVAEGIEAAR